MIEGSGSGSKRPKNMWIRIRIRNTGWRYCNKTGTLRYQVRQKKNNYLRCCTVAPVHKDAGERRKDVPGEGEEGGTTLIPVGGGLIIIYKMNKESFVKTNSAMDSDPSLKTRSIIKEIPI